MEKTKITAALVLALGVTGAQAVTFNFGNIATDGIQGVDFNFTACEAIDFAAGTEVRFCDYSGTALSGALPGHKDTINGTEQWMFNGDITGLMTGVANTATTGGLSSAITYYIDLGYSGSSADRNGGAGLDQGGSYFGAQFGFLAPYLGAEATTAGSPHINDIALDAAQYTATSATTFEILFPIIEMQWDEVHVSLGRGHYLTPNEGRPITFTGTTDGTNFSMWAEHRMSGQEENTSTAFAGETLQWYYNGTIDGFHYTPEVPVPAAAWLFGSGLIALVGAARRKRSI